MAIQLDPPSSKSRELWKKLFDLARGLEPDESWTLIGGLMVQLHAAEAGSQLRPTTDVDLLCNSRSRPFPATRRVAMYLSDLGAEMALPPITDPNLGYQFDYEGHTDRPP